MELTFQNPVVYWLVLSVKAFDKTYQSGGKKFSHSMGISKNQYAEIVEEIKKTISEINLKYSHEPADDVKKTQYRQQRRNIKRSIFLELKKISEIESRP